MAKATRLSFGEELAKLGETNKNIVVLDADLSKSTKSDLFAKKFPERFFEMGIAEANMVSTAAGMALAGKIPFICSFACFITGRYDIIRISIAYNQANVKVIGTHAGIGIGEDGATQMGLEDISLMRSLPNFSVIQPGDDIETKQAVAYSVKHKGPVYLRLTRQNLEDINKPDYKFSFGKGVVLREGPDGTIFATGALVYNSLMAAELLSKEKGINLSVINIHTIKPIDTELIAKFAQKTGMIFTAEDHNIIGGLGSAVAEVISEHQPARLLRIGVPDRFGESGTLKTLYEKYGFTPSGIASKIEEHLKRRCT